MPASFDWRRLLIAALTAALSAALATLGVNVAPPTPAPPTPAAAK